MWERVRVDPEARARYRQHDQQGRGIKRVNITGGARPKPGRDPMTDDVVLALIAASHSADFSTRDQAAMTMGEHLPNPAVESRLVEMLCDSDIAVQTDATESLVTRGGRSGLEAVLRDLGERLEDPDSDHIAYLLQELQGSRNMPILQEARAIVADGTDKTARDVLAELEQLFGHYA
jgi:hypothetical protein